MNRIAGLLAIILACAAWAGWNAVAEESAKGDPGDALLGDWTTEKEESIFHFFREGDLYSARIDWMREPTYPKGDPDAGKPKRDRKNVDKALRDVPLQDYVFIKNFHFKDKKWVGGTIYDPTEGTTYKCQMRIEDGILKVRGYIGVPLLGRTVEWHRPGAELKALVAATKPVAPPAP